MKHELPGLHHITAIASDPQQNVDFYTGVLGLRLVKITINYDDPGSYHFYYGDEAGSPGSISVGGAASTGAGDKADGRDARAARPTIMVSSTSGALSVSAGTRGRDPRAMVSSRSSCTPLFCGLNR